VLILLLLVFPAEPLRWVPQGALYASASAGAFFVLQRKLAASTHGQSGVFADFICYAFG